MTNEPVLDVEILLHGLTKLIETPVVARSPDVEMRLVKAIEHVRGQLPPDHPLHPNQDQDDLPEFGDPHADNG